MGKESIQIRDRKINVIVKKEKMAFILDPFASQIKDPMKLSSQGDISVLVIPIKLIALSFSDFLSFFHHGKKDACGK